MQVDALGETSSELLSGYLQKPYRTHDLVRVVGQALEPGD
jgi:hypothetical protein